MTLRQFLLGLIFGGPLTWQVIGFILTILFESMVFVTTWLWKTVKYRRDKRI